ncbi:uncharacterized protein BO97DRAFT_385215 [Aspergillus homomorphus CBS 101889]|uniref:Uncharacterized protein n=1 Tax=Aspergillus homomorphus (strain CBS 101889) TaxID=1450537 RepID=A0A395I5I5_ASPHC|nr:hypothetical protein BO97DRAFT_385215 [Aspergillus homomorphus CBS 101889]RAL15036.1 hypothetical protein BO97DRAFT_385215 [Aspergillus homomorphus CBS 101889]
MEQAYIIINESKERKIPISRNKVLSALTSEAGATAHANWVSEHVIPDLLLSQEEFTLYSALEDSDDLSNLLSSRITRATRPLSDEELRHSINLLNASTVAIRRQTAIVSSQSQFISIQLQRKEEREFELERDADRLRAQVLSGRQTASVASDEMSRELELNVRLELEKVATEGRGLLSSLTTRLKADDGQLACLERFGHGLQYAGDDAFISKRAIELGIHHAQYVAGEIRYRLDRLYLESVQTDHATIQTGETRAESALGALEEELESLYPEIEILAEMSTKKQLVEPILHGIQEQHGALRTAAHQKLHHLGDIVSKMASSTREIAMGLQDQDSSCGALEAFTAAYRTETSDLLSASSAEKRKMARIQAPQEAFLHAPSASCTAPLFGLQAFTGLQRRVGLILDNLSSKGIGGPLEYLQARRCSLVDSLHGYSLAADSPLDADLFATDWAIQSLLPRLQTNSEPKASLTSVNSENRIAELESVLQYIEEELERLEPGVLYRPDSFPASFLKRWNGQTSNF